MRCELTAEGISVLVAAGAVAASGIAVIFKVGGQYAEFRAKLAEIEKDAVERDARSRLEQADRYQKLLADINGIGAAVRQSRLLADRRYHNSTMIHIINSPKEKQLAVAGMLREEVQ